MDTKTFNVKPIHLMDLLKYILFCSFLLIGPNALGQSQKGVWLTDVASEALDSRKGIEAVVDRCKRYGLDQIYVVVWNRGYYPLP